MALLDLIRSDARIDEIAAHLDGLDATARVHEMYALAGSDQKRLYARAGDSAPLDLDFFVPASTKPLQEVIHCGKNSQPIFRLFQKRWCRPEAASTELWGYNETMLRPLIGPGYFVARATAEGDARGGVVVDYYMVPDAAVVAGWPPVRPNSQGLQRFVYDKTRDYMRRVSKHVSIGEAHRKESRVMGYFALCRQD